MANKSVLVRVPATVSNFGGAKDAAALALDASLNVKVTPRLDGHVGIRYFGENGECVPRDRSNLVARAMESALHLRELEFTGGDFEIFSSVPVGVGLGSSTAAVLAGLIAAEHLFRLEIEEKTLFELASIYETRADNLRAAWLGGFVGAIEEGESVAYRRTVVPENLMLHVVVPETTLVNGSRKPRAEKRAAGSSRADSPRAGKDRSMHSERARELAEFFARPGNGHSAALEKALPPTCEKLIPGLAEALEIRTAGLLAVFACGSGPAVGLCGEQNAGDAVAAVRECFARNGVDSTSFEFRPTNAGAAEWNSVHAEIIPTPTRGLNVLLRKPPTLPV